MTNGNPTPEAILQLGMGFWASKTLLSAVELGLFSELAKGPLTAEALTERLQINPRGARDFFDALVALGMLEREAGLYRPTPATDRFLDRGKPSYVGGLLEMANVRLYGFWGSLTEALRTGKPQNEARRGGNLFAEIYADPQRLAGFVHAMTGVSQGAAAALAEAFPWTRYRRVLDVGTAEGCVPVRLALAHPGLSGGGFDLPPVRPLFEAYVARHGLQDRLAFHAGDFFVDPLPAADVLIMGHILHGVGLADKKRLLAKAYATLPAGGALIVYEAMIDDARQRHAFGLLMSLNMLIETQEGFDFTFADCIGWMREAGFRDVEARPLAGPVGMVTGSK